MRRWWIIPALAGILVISGLAYWGQNLSRERQRLVTYINSRNQGAFFELVGHVENVEAMLSKGIVSNSPTQRMIIFSDIWQQAYAAQENLNQMPISRPSLTRTSRFLTQTGDYAWSLAKKYARGGEVKPEELQKLNELHTEAGYLAAELQKVEMSANEGRVVWGEISGESNQRLKNPPVPDNLRTIDRNMESFPTLIYDGPYSDHIVNRRPTGLTGGNIDRERAAIVARNFVETGANRQFRVVNIDNVDSTIPAYRVSLIPKNESGPLVVTDVSKKGGHVLMMLNTRDVNRPKVSRTAAVPGARKFLADRNIKNMEPTYVIEQQNIGIVIFQYKHDGVLVYPDLMKVKIALDNGEVVGFEGTGFYMNHHDRKIPKPKITEKEARSKVNNRLRINSTRLAVIPLENLQEVLAYEFRGDLNGDEFIVYINAQTGEEEQILKIIDTRSGPLTM